MKRLLALMICVLLCIQNVCTVSASEHIFIQENEQAQTTETVGVEITAPSGILMEASTGQVIFEKNADEKLPPASVTKVMTLLLIFDALASGKIKLEDTVTVSEFAASMGGSQVFLEPGETQSVETMIKCIAVASANDSCVAMAEYINGTEEEFVRQMNERAKGLGMKNTNFVNCNGLDADGHVTTAKDIALMSRELMIKYPDIHKYSMIWMENITHTTKKGTSEFGLTNTNKLVRQYQYATGLKTGSTSKAKFCVSATAKKDDLEMIAVIMAADDSKKRFQDATKLLNYGFGKCTKYEDTEELKLEPLTLRGGVEKEVSIEKGEIFQYVDTTGANLSNIERKIEISPEQRAPIKKGQQVGTIKYLLDGKEIGNVPVITTENVKKMNFKYALLEALESFLL